MNSNQSSPQQAISPQEFAADSDRIANQGSPLQASWDAEGRPIYFRNGKRVETLGTVLASICKRNTAAYLLGR